MKVLTINNTYPPHAYGGYEMACRDVMLRFADAGHDVVVLTSDVRVPGVADVDEPHVHRELFAWWDWERNAPVHPSAPGRWRAERRNQRAVRRLLSRAQPDVVSAWHVGGLSLGILTTVMEAGVPLVLNVHNDWLLHGEELDGWLHAFRDRPAAGRLVAALTGLRTRPPRLADLPAVFVSRSTLERAREGLGAPFPDACVIPVGIDTGDFPITTRAARPFGWRLLYVGRLDEAKGITTLLRAVAELPAQARLDVLGGGNVTYRDHLRGLAAQLGIAERVGFDQVPRAALRERYLDADLVVFPSEWDEPFGLVPLEAMACATPVVASGTGGSRDFLDDGRNCVLFHPGDVTSLRDAITRVASDAALRATIVQGGSDTARRLPIDACAERLITVHEDVAARRRA